jgi:hypothetical protein
MGLSIADHGKFIGYSSQGAELYEFNGFDGTFCLLWDSTTLQNYFTTQWLLSLEGGGLQDASSDLLVINAIQLGARLGAGIVSGVKGALTRPTVTISSAPISGGAFSTAAPAAAPVAAAVSSRASREAAASAGRTPQVIYRTGSQTDAALTDASGVSFRDSVSSAANGGQTFRAGDNIWAVDTARLQPGSVIVDGGTIAGGRLIPPGHVSVRATPAEIRNATIPASPSNPLSGIARPVVNSPISYKIPKN